MMIDVGSTGMVHIALERARQIKQGHSPESDDQHRPGDLARAGAAYAIAAAWGKNIAVMGAPFGGDLRWPWAKDEWKPAETVRENLVRAGALIAAELDRMDRMARACSVCGRPEGDVLHDGPADEPGLHLFTPEEETDA